MKVIVIGGVAGGASAAARVRRLDEKAEITVFERGEHVSFSNCCLPYYLSGTVETADDLVMMTPAGFKKRYNIDVKTSCEITGINRAEHTVTAVDVLTGAEQDYPYDRLVIATGSSPKPLGIPGENGGNVFTVRNVTDVVRIKSFLEDTGAAHVAVYGGGPVGIEVAENLALAGKKITLILHGKQILSSAYDDDMVQLLHRELLNNGIEILLETEVKSIGEGVVSLSGKNGGSTLSADAVILAAGTVPNSELAAAAGLDLASDGAIRTDDAYRTSDPDIYAVGDVIEVYNPLSAGSGRIALAGPAQMAARTAADGICGLKSQSAGFIGSSCIKVFGLNAASTGLTEKKAVRCGYSCDSVLAFPGDKVGIMPDSN